MDNALLALFNRSLAGPLYDAAMLLGSTVGLALAPLAVVFLLWRGRRGCARDPDKALFDRRVGWVLLATLGLTLAATLALQVFAARARPEGVRLLLPTPDFPSFPSGHAAIWAAVTMLLSLAYRRRVVIIASSSITLWVGLSRVALGHHFPSDVLAGFFLGAGLGALAYGVFLARGSLRERLRWLLWPQLASICLVTQLAYLRLLPPLLPRHGDKVLHFVLFGLVAALLDLWLRQRDLRWSWPRQLRVGRSRLGVPLALPVAFTPALIEELLQRLSPARSFELADLAADLAGMIVFLAATRWLVTAEPDGVRCGDGHRKGSGVHP